MAPCVYIGTIPDSPASRSRARERALAFVATMQQARIAEPVAALLNLTPGSARGEAGIDLYIGAQATIVAMVLPAVGPIDILADGRWVVRADNTTLDDGGLSPLDRLSVMRERIVPRLTGVDLQSERVFGAVIFDPQLDSDSNVGLDVAYNRNHLKVFGFDELPGMLSMLDSRSTPRASAEVHRAFSAGLGAWLWHDGSTLLFELTPPSAQLEILDGLGVIRHSIPLYEGETFVGRRLHAQRYERRAILQGDDLISSDHFAVMCVGDRLLLRDMSKNGTWILEPNGAQRRVPTSDVMVRTGVTLRVGQTRLRIAPPAADTR